MDFGLHVIAQALRHMHAYDIGGGSSMTRGTNYSGNGRSGGTIYFVTGPTLVL